MYLCKKFFEVIKKVWFILKYLFNLVIGGNKLWKFLVIVKLNKKNGLDKKKKWGICLKFEKLLIIWIYVGVNIWCVEGLVMEMLDDM